MAPVLVSTSLVDDWYGCASATGERENDLPDGKGEMASMLVGGSLESKIESDLVRSESHPWGFKFFRRLPDGVSKVQGSRQQEGEITLSAEFALLINFVIIRQLSRRIYARLVQRRAMIRASNVRALSTTAKPLRKIV